MEICDASYRFTTIFVKFYREHYKSNIFDPGIRSFNNVDHISFTTSDKSF